MPENTNENTNPTTNPTTNPAQNAQNAQNTQNTQNIKNPIAVVDGNYLMHRSYHAIRTSMLAPDGTHTNAIYGFLNTLLSFYNTYQPTRIYCAFDAGKSKARTDLLPEYKAQRKPMDDELREQFPVIDHLLEALNIPVIKVPGWEGDDILGTLSKQNETAGGQTLILTGDKDMNQLVTESTFVIKPAYGAGAHGFDTMDTQAVFDKYGIWPRQFRDLLGIMGDSSDNYKGVMGIGEKGAVKLLAQFDTLEGIYEHIDDIKGTNRNKLIDYKDDAFLCRKIATIFTDLDVLCDMTAQTFPAFSKSQVKDAFDEYRLVKQLPKYLDLCTHDLAPSRAAKSVSHDDESEVPSQKPLLPPTLTCTFDSQHTQDIINNAINTQAPIGIKVCPHEPENLFDEGEDTYIFATESGIVCIEGQAGKEALVRALTQGNVVCENLHELLRHVCPPNNNEESLLTVAQLANVRALDLGLASYVLNSNAPTKSIEDLSAHLASTHVNTCELEVHSTEPSANISQDLRTAIIHAAAILALKPYCESALEKTEQAKQVYENIDLPLTPTLVQMERTGMCINTQTLHEISTKTALEIEDLRAQILELAGEDFNLDSPKQLSHVLFDVLGLPPKKKTSTGYSTNAQVLTQLEEEGAEIAGHVLKYRELTKIKNTYIDALPRMISTDGRIHTTFHATVTATGRLSSSDPNLQNIPVRTPLGKHIRECFVPLEEGHVFLGADYSQIELRVLAHMSEDPGLIDAFSHGADFHTQTAAATFGVAAEDVTPEQRRRAKAVNFGIVYGQQSFGLAQSLDIPVKEAKEIIDRYFETYPVVREYLDKIVEDAKDTGYAQTMFGRRRYIPELSEKNKMRRAFGARTAMNHPMQGSAADIIKLAMVRVQNRILSEGLSAKLMMQVHDELDFSVPKGEVETLSSIVREEMEGVVDLRVPLVVDISTGSTWAQAH